MSNVQWNAAGGAYPGGGTSGSTFFSVAAYFYQPPGANLGNALAVLLATGSPALTTFLANVTLAAVYSCRGCGTQDVTFTPSLYTPTICVAPTCFPPFTTAFGASATPTPTPSATPNAATATVTFGSVALTVIGLPTAACAAAEAACLQAVASALGALLPPPAPPPAGGVSVVRYFDSSATFAALAAQSTTFESSFAVMQQQAMGAPGALPVGAALRLQLGGSGPGGAALVTRIAQAAGIPRPSSLSLGGVSVSAVDYAAIGSAVCATGGGAGAAGVSATVVVLILLVVLQCVSFGYALCYCGRRGARLPLPPWVIELFALGPRRTAAAVAGAGAGAGTGANGGANAGPADGSSVLFAAAPNKGAGLGDEDLIPLDTSSFAPQPPLQAATQLQPRLED